MKTKLKYISMLAVLIGISSHALAVTKAGDAPKGTVKTTPDLDYMGVGMKMELSATDLEDMDCKDGEEEPDSIDSSNGVKFEVSAGSLSSSTSPTPKLTLPTTAGDVTITLKVDDKGDVHNDGGFVTGGTKVVKVRVPESAVADGAGSACSSPVYGWGYKVLVKDNEGQPFKVAGLTIKESYTGIVNLHKDGTLVYASEPDTVTKTIDNTLGSDGKFVDPIGVSEAELQNKKDYWAATNSLKIKILTSEHIYCVRVETHDYWLPESFTRTGYGELTKGGNGQWTVTSYGK